MQQNVLLSVIVMLAVMRIAHAVSTLMLMLLFTFSSLGAMSGKARSITVPNVGGVMCP